MRIFWVLLLLVSFGAYPLTQSQNKTIGKISQAYGERAGLRVNTWYNLIQQLRFKSKEQQLNDVNVFFNRLYYMTDEKMWGVSDFWATPYEFLGASAGDCEDYAIAKYYTLKQLGFNDNKLRLIYVKALQLNQFHMVLAYYPTPSSIPLILDNIDGVIKKADQRRDLYPIYSFNASKLWLMKKNGKTGSVKGSSSRISLWQKVQDRERTLNFKKPIINFDE